MEGLNARGIGFRSLTEAIDTTTSDGKLVFHIFGALAEFERSIIRERTRAGLASAKARGRTGGRPKKLTDVNLRAAMAMRSDDSFTADEVAKHLKVSPATPYRYLPAPVPQSHGRSQHELARALHTPELHLRCVNEII